MTMTLYSCPQTRGTRVTWMLEEVGAEYAYVKVDLMSGAGWRAPFVELNPGGKVPVLVDGGLVLTESAAICTYLGDRFPDAGLVPEPRTARRAQYDSWCFFVLSELEQPLWTAAKHSFALPEKHRVPAVIDTARWEFSVAAKVLARGLGESPYILGDAFTAADILIAHTLSWARHVDFDSGSESLTAYADRVLGRPALARARERETRAGA